jgi:3-deoxy-D-manno-octulosonate 8-phosphate phosphatase (KDO 8-P phosphatase)
MAARARSRRSVPLSRIRLLVLDADGVLTDGRLHYGAGGERHKSFHVRDGYGIKAALAAGIAVAVISGRRSGALKRRCEELGIRLLGQGIEDKRVEFERLLARLGLAARDCACVGDDAPDVPLLEQAGLAVAVADAHPSAVAVAHRRTRAGGGAGAVREVCDWLLDARRKAAAAPRRASRPVAAA